MCLGLGVDINTTNYSMSEAMLSINNIALSNHLKQVLILHIYNIKLLKDPYLFKRRGFVPLR